MRCCSCSSVAGNPSAREVMNFCGNTDEQSFRKEPSWGDEEITKEYSDRNAMSCGWGEIKEKESARNYKSFVNKQIAEEQAPREIESFYNLLRLSFITKNELARMVRSYYGKQITEIQSSQVKQLLKLNEPATFVSELIKNDKWLSSDMKNMTPLLESIMPALNEQYSISLVGSKSEFSIQPPGVYFNDTELRCSRKGCVAEIAGNFDFGDLFEFRKNSFKCYSSIEAKPEFGVLYTCRTEVRSRIVHFEKECKNTLHPIIQNVFASYSARYREVRDNENCSLFQTDDEYTFLERYKSATTVSYSEDEITPFVPGRELVSSIDFVDIIECINWPTDIKYWLNSKPKSGWPDKTLKQKVISSGCDILIHTESDTYHRNGSISFSKAEQILINSWNPVQQVVYHVFEDFLQHQTLLQKNIHQ